jgi:hypothetical protein
MGAPQYEQAGADVAGSGTPGTIPVWSGSGTTLGDSPLTVSGTTVTATQAFTVNGTHTFNGNLVSGFNQTWTLNGGFLNIQSGLLYLDKTNSRIGIGTAGPGAKLHIGSGSYAGASLDGVRLTNGINSYYTASDGTRTSILGADGNAFVGTLTNHSFVIRSNNTNAITIDTAQNVGIGTASPAYRLHVAGNTAGVVGNPNSNAGWYATDGTRTAYLIASNGGTGEAGVGTQTAHAFTFFTAATERMRIDSSGNVGIGTGAATPGRKLEISSSAPLRMGTGGEYFDFLQYSSGTWAWFSSAGQYVAAWKTSGAMGFGGVTSPATNTVDVSTASWGLKLPSTPGNGDAQTFDAYNEVTLSSGFVTSGITSTGTIVITARITRYARGFGVHMKVAPSGGASLTFAAGWYVTLTGAPQMPEQGALSAYTTDGVGRVAVQIDGNATPSIAGMTTGNYGALGANVAVICSGFVT